MRKAALWVNVCLLLGCSSTEQNPAGSDGGSDGGATKCGTNGTCAPAPPANWLGPVAVWFGDAKGPLPACQQGWVGAKTLYAPGTTFPAAQCTPCVCSAASAPGECFAELQIGNDASCSGGTMSIGETCTSIGNISGFVYGKVTGFSFKPAGSCVPSGGAPTLPPPASGTALVACASAATCKDGICAPGVGGGFLEQCIYREGKFAGCPTGSGFDVASEWVEVSDKRGCTSCTCGTPTKTCGGTVEKFYTAACDSATGQFEATCDQKFANDYARLYATKDPPSCAPSGGAPEGDVQRVTYTLCCRS